MILATVALVPGAAFPNTGDMTWANVLRNRTNVVALLLNVVVILSIVGGKNVCL